MEAYRRLEIEWAEWVGVSPEGAVVCSSGTSALHLAWETLRPSAGNLIGCPNLTMIACARAVALAGLTNLFIDCDDNLLMETGNMQEAVNLGIRGIMPVHMYGRRCNMEVLATTAEKEKLIVVEDAAEAHGVSPHPKSDAYCVSFFKNKVISCADGEGGAVWFKDHAHARLARSLRTLGFTADHNFMHVARGHNYRMSNVHADLILRSLRLVAAGIGGLEARREIEAWCDELCPAAWRMPRRDSVWTYDMILPDGDAQDRAVAALRAAGIEARHCFAPMHMQEEFAGCRRVGGVNAERLAKRVMYLPVKPGLSRAWYRHAFEILGEAVG